MAPRLARLVYRMLKYGQRDVDKGSECYENRYRQQQIDLLQKKAGQARPPDHNSSAGLSLFLGRNVKKKAPPRSRHNSFT